MTFNVKEIVESSKENRKKIASKLEMAFGDKSLEYDLNGKPRLDLNPLKETAVRNLTQEEYDNLMQVYEAGGWKWLRGNNPTELDHFYEENICVSAGTYPKGDLIVSGGQRGFVGYGSKNFAYKGFRILSPEEFYTIQGINQKTLNEINEWFETNKPDRRSKGK